LVDVQAAERSASNQEANVAIYMRFDSIPGDATQIVGGHDLTKDSKDPATLQKQGWININVFAWKIDRKLTTRTPGSHGKSRDPTQQASVDEITVKKEADSATVPLMKAICNNKDSDTCTIIWVKTGGEDHAPAQVYMEYKLSNVFIVEINVALEGERHVETLKLNFTKVEMAFLASDTANVLSKAQADRFQFDKQTAPPGGAKKSA
jgi:type VI secretion system secreted protein Hcp